MSESVSSWLMRSRQMIMMATGGRRQRRWLSRSPSSERAQRGRSGSRGRAERAEKLCMLFKWSVHSLAVCKVRMLLLSVAWHCWENGNRCHLLNTCKASAYNVGDLGSIPGSGRSSGEGNGNPLQYSCLENPIDGGSW